MYVLENPFTFSKRAKILFNKQTLKLHKTKIFTKTQYCNNSIYVEYHLISALATKFLKLKTS